MCIAGCDLQGSDWQSCRIREVLITGCDLRGADLSGARFDSVELRDSRLDGIRGAANLGGVRMSWDDVLANAAVFAAACGVRVDDDGS